jgi:hypothetical protein
MAAEVSQAAQQLVSAPEADASGGSALRSALRSGKLMTGTVILAIFVVIAIIGPDLVRTNPSALSSAVLQGPSAAHWLGTTQTGQDIFAQLIDSTRISMLVGFVAAAIATVLSIIIGVAGGYAGGVVDELLSVLSNVFLVIPALPLVDQRRPGDQHYWVGLGRSYHPGPDTVAAQTRLRRGRAAQRRRLLPHSLLGDPSARGRHHRGQLSGHRRVRDPDPGRHRLPRAVRRHSLVLGHDAVLGAG